MIFDKNVGRCIIVLKHSFKFRVRYQETDRMGIVYHSNYIIWFDMGRTEFMRALGYSYRELEEKAVWLPIIEVGCTYKSPAKYDDEITVETFIEELTRVKIKFGYRIYRGEELLVEGFTKQGFTNDKLKPVALNKVLPEVYSKLEECIK
jgi:acyl-CoA thioester hydrolase